MQVDDLRALPDGLVIDTDIVIVGSGPAGLSVARELGTSSTRVVIVESGGLEEERDIEALNEIESVGALREKDQSLLRRRMFGGSSNAWLGRVAAFEETDYQFRPWVPFSGWPIKAADLAPYIERAARQMELGPNCYDEALWEKLRLPPPDPDVDRALLRPVFWQYSLHPGEWRVHMRFGSLFLALNPDNVRVLLHATARHINTNDEGTVFKSVEVTCAEGKNARVEAKAMVLAAGGIDNPRLLLASNGIIEGGVGNAHDMVGRFLMDHPRGILGTFDPAGARPVQDRYDHFRLKGSERSHYYAHGVALSGRLQRLEGLLNCAGWVVEQRADDDPWEAMKRLAGRNYSRLAHDAAAVAANCRLIASGVYRRIVERRGLPHKSDRVLFLAMSEQRPDPGSRITLSERRDRLGLPVPLVDWKINADEKRSLMRLGQIAAAEFRRLGLPEMQLAEWVRSENLDQAELLDVGHPTGTTRMSDDPNSGVVDRSGQVHGVNGLYVTGTSVFSTAGHANPTLMIAAMAIRLADHLKECSVASAGTAPRSHAQDRAIPASHTAVRRVLVTGGTGKIGRSLVQDLVQKGYTIRVVSTQDPAEAPGVEWHKMDWLESLDFDAAVEGCEAVLHLGAELGDPAKMMRVNVDATEALVTASERAGVRFFCYTSSISVYGSPRSRVVTEDSPVVSTHADVKQEYWIEDFVRAYARTKLLGEQRIKERARNIEYVILRPTVVVDLDDIINARHWSSARRFLFGGRHTHHVYVKDVAHGIAWFLERAAGRERVPPSIEIYNFSNDDLTRNTYASLLHRFDRATGAKQFALPLRAPELFDLAFFMAKHRSLDRRYPLGMMRVPPDKLYRTGYRHAYGMAKAYDLALRKLAGP